MSRSALPFVAGDVSALARSLREQLGRSEGTPGHVELLNMLARSVGFRNFQHFRAQPPEAVPASAPVAPAPPQEAVDPARVARMLRYFDAEMRLLRWPPKLSHRQACLWVIWSRLPRRAVFTEKEISERLRELHAFGDHALLRRWLCDCGMVTRTVDGSQYRRIETRPPAEARMLIRLLHGRAGTG